MAANAFVLDDRLESLRSQLRALTTQCEELTDCAALDQSAAAFFTPERYATMERIAKKSLWLGVLMIDQKRQGHPASTASSMQIMTAIYFSRAYDWLRFARGELTARVHQCESQKPHAVPGWDGLIYLEGLLTQEQVQAFRTFGGPNAYPTHVDPGIQIPTGSLGLGPGAAVGLAFVDQYNAEHDAVPGRGLQISIIGDSEFDEGVIHESIKERASRGLTGWIDFIDYNRQSLDGNLDERLVDRIAGLYDSYGIPVVVLKYGSKLQEVFRGGRGGREFRRRLDALSTEDYQALLRQPANVIRRMMTLRRPDFEAFLHEGFRRIDGVSKGNGQPAHSADVELESLFASKSDEEFKEIFSNLGGHDLPMLVSAIEKIKRESGCAAIIAYTVKGWGVQPLVGSLSGHWQMLQPGQLDDFARHLGPEIVRPGAPWERFPDGDPAQVLLTSIASARQQFAAALDEERRCDAEYLRQELGSSDGSRGIPLELPEPTDFQPDQSISTQAYLGRLLGRLSTVQSGEPLGVLVDRIVTIAADVAYTAGLREWVNQRGVWGHPLPIDVVRKYGEVPELDVRPRPAGQHVRLSNLEQFLGLLAAAFGKSHELMGVRRLPIAFFYDVFLERFAEMFKYAAYWDSAVFFVGTIAGASAPGESGLHHGATPGVIGRMIPNVVTWEPAFPLELNWIMADEFRRVICGTDAGRRVRYLRTTATPVMQSLMDSYLRSQPRNQNATLTEILESVRTDVLSGGYCLIDRRHCTDYQPGRNVVNLFAIGSSVVEAIQASESLMTAGLFANVIVVTSPTLLIDDPKSHQLDSLITEDERRQQVPLVTVTDSHPSHLQGVARRLSHGGAQPAEVLLGVTAFDRSGTAAEIKKFHGIDASSIIRAARCLLATP